MPELEVDLTVLVGQNDRILTQLGEFRDDLRFMMAILQRIEGTISGLVDDMDYEPAHDRFRG